jgi:hypothetical protein
MTKKMKKVSKKKIVFVELDEEITSIFEKISKLNYKDIYLVVPRRAILLQSVVNLKILKQKLEDIKKSMAIITDDANGMKLAHQAEIKVYDHFSTEKTLSGKQAISKTGGVKRGESDEEKSHETMLSPISATSNEIGEDAPMRLPKKKSSIFEVVRTLRGRDKGFSLSSYLREWKKNRLTKEAFPVYLPGGNKRFITGLLVVSVVVFGLIAYVALPGATIMIEPASDVLTKAVNVELERSPSDARTLKAYSLATETEYTISHMASGIVSEGTDASGNITIFNETDTDWTLVKETRFQTADGIVFRLQSETNVPRSSGVDADGFAIPGSAEAYVLADSLDANGSPSGERGNIEASEFFLPGLRESSRENLYAVSYEAMAGGTTAVSALVLEDDLIAARDKLETQLYEKALAALRKEALSQSNSLGVTLDLLEDSDVLIYSTAKIDLPYELVGQEMEEFEVTGEMSISGIAYDSDELLALLKTEILAAETPGKQLVRIDDDSVNVDVMEADNVYLYYKFTAQIQGIEEYEIDPELEGGSQLAKKIKEHIAGKSIEDAENYVQNLPEVNRVEIKLWPGWSPNIPTLPENIRIRSMSDNEVVELE